MNNYNLLKLSFVWCFHNKIMLEFSLTSFGTLRDVCVIKTREKFSFLPLINSFNNYY